MTLKHIAEVFAQSGHLPCAMDIDNTHDATIITIRLRSDYPHVLEVRSVVDDLQWLSDVASIREFARRYGIGPNRLEVFLGRKEE